MNLSFRKPNDQEFEQIRSHIKEFELDDRNLIPEEFTAAFLNNELVGFGRLRNHADCTELCSLGVVKSYRNKKVGKTIVEELIRISPYRIYIVCIIPQFFISSGFRIIADYPLSIKNKLDYCIHDLPVPEEYVVLVHENSRIAH